MKKKAGKECFGLFNSIENCIYVATDQTKEQALHTLLHELIHSAETQLELLDDEAKADIMASWMIRFFKLKSIEKVLK
jgi:Zn-dependent peptidase ImmA (M78 family)